MNSSRNRIGDGGGFLPPNLIASSWKCTLLLALSACMLEQSLGALLEIKNLEVAAEPMTVGSPSILKFNATLQGSYFQTGQALILTVEHPGNFNLTPADATSLYMQQKCISAVAGIFITNCTLRKYTAYMNMTVNSIQLSTVQIQIRDFRNPNSTQPIAFSLQLIDQNQVMIAETLSNITLKNWVPARLISTQLASSSALAGALADLVVSFTPQNQLFPKGKVVVKFPLWNSLLDDPYRHYIQSDTITCANVTNMNPAMKCSYNKNTQELTVDNPVVSLTQWKPLVFRISQIRNPFSARPRGDFWIKTVNESGYMIDASENMTLTVSSYGSIKSASFVRNDLMTTVSEPSKIVMNYSIDFPIAFPCRVVIQYPSDMRQFYPVGYVFSILSNGIVEGTLSSAPFGELLQQSGFTTIYMTSSNCGFNPYQIPQKNPVFYNSWNMPMTNKAWVKESGTVQIGIQELFDGVYYPVAIKSSGLTFPQEAFTPGTIQSTSVTTVASTGGLVKFKITITPSHYIPSNSRLIITLPPSVCLNPGKCTISTVSGSMVTTVDLCYVDGSTITINTPFGKSGFYQKGQADLSFVLNSLGTNPGSEVLSSQYIGVETYAVENGLGYEIDKQDPQSLPVEKLLASTYAQSTTSCTANSAKFCGSNGKFNPLFKFHQFEGSIALLQSGIFITQDEARSQFLNPTPTTCAGGTQNSILSVMQVGNNRNDFDQNTFSDEMFPYINSLSTSLRDPFGGGIFSFERCTYVFNMGFNPATDQRLYNIKKYQISIEHDNALKRKKTVINIEKDWVRSQAKAAINHQDFPCKTLTDGLIYHPGIRGIIYFVDTNRKILNIKADLDTSVTDDMCVVDFLGASHRWGQYQLDLAYEFEKIKFTVSSFPPNPFVFLNNELYVVAYGRNREKYPFDTTLKQTMIAKVTLTPSTTTTILVAVKNVTEIWGQIDSIYALEMQGLIFTVSNSTSTGYNVLDLTPGLYDSVKAGPTPKETEQKWKLFQARQDNHMHRPIFGVKVTEKNSLYRITKIAQKVLEDKTFNTNFYDFGVQLNRFFGLTVLPGSCYCGTLDRFNSIKGILLDLRGMKVDRCIDLPMFGCGDSRLATRNDEQCDDGNLANGDGCSKDCKVEAWWQCSQIEGERSICTPKLCGNGVLDTGEECDDGNAVNGDGCTSACIEEKGFQCLPFRAPHCKWMCGDNLVYQQKKYNADGSQYLYYEEKCDTNSGGCLSTCEPDLGWNCTTTYPTMISTCVQTCGNSKNDADMKEICDDGNNLSGDGCSKGCTVIEAPYACPLVGKCNMNCGNGFFEGVDPRIGRLIGTENELCDDGNRDSGDGCSNVCEIEPGWTCVNKFIGLRLEEPGFKSFCVRSGSGIGDMGQADNKALYQMSQVEEYSWDKYTARGSVSGKFRLIEYQGQRSGTKVELQGVTFVTRANKIFEARELTVVKQWQGGVYTDYVDTSRVLNTATGVGIQRGTFGPFVVRTDSNKQLGFYSFLESEGSPDVTFGKFYSTLDITPAEFMGGHEVYYWPHFNVILARLGDGYTFKVYRFTPNVISVAKDQTQFSADEWIEDAFKRGIEIPGEIKVEPVFFQNYMAILQKLESDALPMLRIYKFLEQIETFDPNFQSTKPNAQSSQYLGYSLVYFGSDFGLLYKEHNNPSLLRVALPLKNYNPTIEANSFIPDVEHGKLVFIQRRHDPMSEEEEARDVYGYYDNSAVYKFEGDATLNKLRITQKISLPTIGVFITENRMIDVGKYYLAVYSAANCDAVVNQSIITKASAWFYNFLSGAWTCMDIPVIQFVQWQQFAWWTNATPTII